MAKKTNKPNIIDLDDTPDFDDFIQSVEAQTSDMFVEEFLNTFIREYGFYVIETRALPHILDGLRIGARKILFATINSSIRKKAEKMGVLIGETFKMEYHHGDASLQNTIEFLSSDHLFKYHPLIVDGQIPTLRISKVKTAPRYLKVKTSPYFFMYEYDKELWEIKEEDGIKVEPEFLFPIVPMQLLQRTSSPGFGFSYSSFSYKLEDLIDNCIISILNGTCDSILNKQILRPEIVGIKDENIIYNEAKQCWYNVGEYQIENDKLIITDLPYNITLEKYEALLNNYEEKFLIKSWVNKSKGKVLRYEINFAPGQLKLQYSQKWKFYQKFNLFKKIKNVHLNQLDLNGKTILFFENEHKLIDGFVIRRLNFYRKRKTKLIDKLNNDILELDDKALFLKLVLDEKILINKRKISDIKKDCDKFGVSYEGLKLSISKLTIEEYEKYLNEIEEIKNYLEYIKTVSEKQMYIDDLVDLREKVIGFDKV
jgi:DNA topoisomerase-2